MTKSAPKYETKIEIEVPQASYTNEPFDAAAVKDMLKKAGVDVKTVTITDTTVAQPGKADAPPAKTGACISYPLSTRGTLLAPDVLIYNK